MTTTKARRTVQRQLWVVAIALALLIGYVLIRVGLAGLARLLAGD